MLMSDRFGTFLLIPRTLLADSLEIVNAVTHQRSRATLRTTAFVFLWG